MDANGVLQQPTYILHVQSIALYTNNSRALKSLAAIQWLFGTTKGHTSRPWEYFRGIQVWQENNPSAGVLRVRHGKLQISRWLTYYFHGHIWSSHPACHRLHDVIAARVGYAMATNVILVEACHDLQLYPWTQPQCDNVQYCSRIRAAINIG